MFLFFFFWWEHKLYSLVCRHAKLLQSCLSLCDSMDHSLPGSSVYGILQARILEWVAMPSSSGPSWPRDESCVLCLLFWQMGSLPLAPPAKPLYFLSKLQLYNTVLSAIVNILYIRSSDPIHRITESLYSFTKFSLFPPTLAPGNHFLNLCFYKFSYF